MIAAIREAMKPNWIDRAVGYVAPVLGARRMQARAAMALSGYIGARWDRRATKEWYVPSGTADDTLLPDSQTLRDRSRDLIRNSPLATGAVNTVVQNVVGGGLQLQARPEWESLGMSEDQADEWKASVEREFRLWAESTECDITRTQNFYGLQDLVFRAVLEAGDCAVLTPMIPARTSLYSLRLQVIESERLANPDNKQDTDRLKAGIEFDENGAPVAYHIRRKHPYSFEGLKDRSATRIDAFGKRTGRRNVLHPFERKRPGQSRGVPYLAPVIEQLKQLDRYSEAEVMAAVVSAMFTVFVKTQTGDGLGPLIGETSTAPSSANPKPGQEVKLGNGAIVDLLPGEDVAFANPGRPNSQFDAFVQAVLRQVGVALGLPFEVLVKHFTASYSAARAALLEAWCFYRGRREFLAQAFCAPAYEAWMDEAVALGRVDAPGYFDDPALRRAYLQAEWIGSAPAQIDPEKEVGAAEKRLQIGVSTLADETMLLTGKVWEDQHRQQVKERRMRERDGLLPAAAQGAPQRPGPKPEEGGSDLEEPEAA